MLRYFEDGKNSEVSSRNYQETQTVVFWLSEGSQQDVICGQLWDAQEKFSQKKNLEKFPLKIDTNLMTNR